MSRPGSRLREIETLVARAKRDGRWLAVLDGRREEFRIDGSEPYAVDVLAAAIADKLARRVVIVDAQGKLPHMQQN